MNLVMNLVFCMWYKQLYLYDPVVSYGFGQTDLGMIQSIHMDVVK